MSWHGIYGHDRVLEQLRRSAARGRLAGTYLFVGPEGIGKRTFALKLAQSLLCSQAAEAALDPCEQCNTCIQVRAQSHPDLHLVSRPEGRSTVPLELLLGPPERRMQEGLCHSIALRPFSGRRKVAIIDDADYLAVEGANALLKTLEEPPPGAVLILIGTSPEKQLPTIRSRCQTIRFQPLEPSLVARLLVETGLVPQHDEAARLAAYSSGSLTVARELADPELWNFRQRLLPALARVAEAAVELSREVNAFVEAAGKEASARRIRARQVLGFALALFRGVLRAAGSATVRRGGAPSGELPGTALDDPLLRSAVEAALGQWALPLESAAACASRTLEALDEIERHALLPGVIDCWLDELAQATRHAAAAGW
jgi:DNA polymerase-3 subunit delta'